MPKRSTQGDSSYSASVSGSFDEWLRYFGVDEGRRLFSIWPPDVFAIAAAFLRRTGGYIGLIGSLQGGRAGVVPFAREDAQAVGVEWRRALREGLQRTGGSKEGIVVPPQIKKWW